MPRASRIVSCFKLRLVCSAPVGEYPGPRRWLHFGCNSLGISCVQEQVISLLLSYLQTADYSPEKAVVAQSMVNQQPLYPGCQAIQMLVRTWTPA
jgi:hypothetical protein